MRLIRTAAVFLVLGLTLGLTSCFSCSTKQDPNELREKTAQTTANLKQDAKSVAQGIREGWSRSNQLDLNTATQKDLTSLPGITPRLADRIIESRPYESTDELVSKRVLPRAEYNKIADQVTVKKVGK